MGQEKFYLKNLAVFCGQNHIHLNLMIFGRLGCRSILDVVERPEKVVPHKTLFKSYRGNYRFHIKRNLSKSENTRKRNPFLLKDFLKFKRELFCDK